jgi:TRAP transporter TAXI family solute receptor
LAFTEVVRKKGGDNYGDVKVFADLGHIMLANRFCLKNRMLKGGLAMKSKKCSFIIVATLLIALIGITSQAVGKDIAIKVLGLTLGGGGHLFTATFADVISRYVPGATAVAVAGSTAPNVKNVSEGNGDIGFSSPVYEAEAWNGTGRFQGKPMKNLRHLFYQCGTAQVMFVLVGSPIKTYEELKNKKINLGTKGYTSTQAGLAILQVYGLTPEKIEANGGSVSWASSNDAARMLQDRTIDAMFFNSGTDQIEDQMLPVEETIGLRILKAGPEQLKEANKLMLGSFITTLKGGVYKHEPKDIPCIGNGFTMVCRDDLPEDVAYNIVKAVFEHEDVFRALKGPWLKFTLSEALKGAYLPVHPGALRYYKEKKVAK